MRQVWIAAVLATGCVSSDSVECGGRVCPKGTTCIELMAVSAGDPHRCVDPDAVTACGGVAGLDSCSYADVSIGACYATTAGEVCLAAGCGNGLVDKDEVCDDGNAEVNDGCSDACQSDETCGNGIVDPSRLEVCDDGNHLGHDGCTPGCASETLRWTPITPGDPSPRIGASMAYDSIRGRIVMVGGTFVSSIGGSSRPRPQPGTYESDGTTWNRALPELEPSPRLDTALAFDAARRVSVLFGGDDGALRGDTWVWDGTSWQLLAPAMSPPPRSRHAMTYDVRRKRVVLFGGIGTDLSPLDDTWEWDGTTWLKATPAAKPPASEARATYDPARGVVVLVVGSSSTSYETWEYDGTTWTMKANSVATPQTPSIAYDAVMSRVVAYAAREASITTFAWDGTTWTDLGDAGAGIAGGVSLASEPGGHVIQFGGTVTTGCPMFCLTSSRSSTYGWNGTTWTQRVAEVPAARAYASAALDTRHGIVVMVGGWDPNAAGSSGFQDVWEYDGFAWTSSASQPWTGGRLRAAMAYDSLRDEMVLFGGDDAATTTFSNETWIRSGGTWLQASPAASPGVRSGAVAAYDPVRHRVVLFGGVDQTANFLDETWLWDGSTWTKAVPAHKPASRINASIAWDPMTQTIVLFGGDAASTQLSQDTWSWDGTDWTEKTPAFGPPPRRDGRLAWSGALGALLLHGGAGSDTALDDLWAWSGSAWTPLPSVDRPTATVTPALTSSPDGAGLFMFGGDDFSDITASADASVLRSDAPVAYEECATAIDADGDSAAGCADPDCWARCSPACSPGAPCDTAAPHCGDGACNAALENCRNCAADCTTCDARCGDSFCDPGETAAACPGDCTP